MTGSTVLTVLWLLLFVFSVVIGAIQIGAVFLRDGTLIGFRGVYLALAVVGAYFSAHALGFIGF